MGWSRRAVSCLTNYHRFCKLASRWNGFWLRGSVMAAMKIFYQVTGTFELVGAYMRRRADDRALLYQWNDSRPLEFLFYVTSFFVSFWWRTSLVVLQDVAGNVTQVRRLFSIAVAYDCCATFYVVYDDLIYCFVPEATLSSFGHNSRYTRDLSIKIVDILWFVIPKQDLHHSSYTTAAKAGIYCFYPRSWVAASQLSQSGATWRPHTFAYRNHHLSVRIGHPDMISKLKNAKVTNGRGKR